MNLKDLEYRNIVGSGYFCNVKKYKSRETGELIAIKELKEEHIGNEDYRNRFKREVRITKDLRGSANIIDVLYEGGTDNYWYAMPFAENNLYKYISRNNQNLTIEQRLFIIEEIINAMEYAHSKSKLHRDLSPQNILIFEKNNSIQVKISDFGLGKDMESLSHLTRVEADGYGQALYVAPEQFENLNNATEKSDIYSLGKIIYLIIKGREPRNVEENKLSVLINKCIKEESSDRYSDILEMKKEFLKLKDLLIGSVKLDINSISVGKYLEGIGLKNINYLNLHHVILKNKVDNHVFYDFLEPITELLLGDEGKLYEYYDCVGNSILEFIKIYIKNINECASMTRWDFRYTARFGDLLFSLYNKIDIDEAKLILLQCLWELGVESNQYSVQRIIKRIIEGGRIPEDIVVSFAQYISNSKNVIELNSNNIQKPIKIALSIY